MILTAALLVALALAMGLSLPVAAALGAVGALYYGGRWKRRR